ncbi:MAG: ATP-binding protein [Lachnospiraceae bacterium]
MMTELSLNVLDVAQNSVRAEASLIQIEVHADTVEDMLAITIRDNGCGMTEEQIRSVTDPFYTTRTTRKVGLGVPFFKMAAENTGGIFSIESKPGMGTTVYATFGLSHIDRMPLGDMAGTIHMLVTLNPQIDFIYQYMVDERSFVLDTREFREILGDISFDSPEVSAYIKEYLVENQTEVNGKVVL